MAAGRPLVWQSTVQAWRDAVEVLRALPGLMLTVLAISIGISLLSILLIPFEPGTRPLLVSFVISGIQNFLVTPYLIAVHRFIILGERTARYDLAPGTHRFQLFFLWSMTLSISYWMPSFAVSGGRVEAILLSLMWLMLWLIVMVVMSIVSLRLIILFPAIAVDAPGATWRNAMADTKGNFWRIFFICLVALLPIVVMLVLLVRVTAATNASASPAAGAVFAVILRGVIGVIAPTVAVALASRLYQQLGERLNRA